MEKKKIIEVGWAQDQGPSEPFFVQALDTEVTRNFGRRINEANMGQVLRGRTIDGKTVCVKIGKRYQ